MPEQEVSKVNDETSLAEMVKVVWKHKLLVVGGTLGTGAAVLMVMIITMLLPPEVSFLPNVFKPSAAILIGEDSGGGLGSALASSGLGGIASLAGLSASVGTNGPLAAYLATTNSSLDELSRSYNLSGHYHIDDGNRARTRKAILEHLDVSLDDKTNILAIAFEDRDPKLAQSIVNSLVDILSRKFEALGGNKARDQQNFLQQKLADVQIQIDQIESKIKAFQGKYGVLSVEALATEQISILAQMRTQLILKDLEIQNYAKFSKIDDPIIRGLKSERDSLQEKIVQLESGGSVLPSQRDIPKLAFEYAGLERDLMVQNEVFKTLTQQYELAKLNSDGRSSIFQVVELAEVPDRKSGPSRGFICIVTTAGGFFFFVLLSFLIELFGSIWPASGISRDREGASL